LIINNLNETEYTVQYKRDDTTMSIWFHYIILKTKRFISRHCIYRLSEYKAGPLSML